MHKSIEVFHRQKNYTLVVLEFFSMIFLFKVHFLLKRSPTYTKRFLIHKMYCRQDN